MEQRQDRRIFVKVLRAIGLRVLAWGGLLLVVGFLLGYIRLPDFRTTPQPTVPTTVKRDELRGPGWPHLRGPKYNSTSDETDLPDTWPDEGPLVLWVKELGQGYSGFSAVGGRIWTQRQTAYAQTVVCLDGDTGRLIWEHKYGWPYQAAGMYPGPRATPTWHDGKVYFAGPQGQVGCLRANDGHLLWSVNVNETYGGRGTDFGYSCSPTVIDGKVILPVGGEGASVVALNSNDGSKVWAAGDQPASYTSAIPVTFQGRKLIVGYLQNAWALHDSESGQLLCSHRLSTGYDEHATLPLYREPHLLFTGPFRWGAAMYELSVQTPEDADNTSGLAAQRIWHSDRMSNDVASSILVDGYVYGFDLRDIQSKARRPSRGEFRCLDFETGEVQWSSDRPGHASVILADGKLILFNDRGEVLLARPSPEAYEELARTEVFGGEVCWTAPALENGRLYLRSPTRAACLYVGKTERLEQTQLAGARPASEIPRARTFDFAWLVSGERDCPADAPDMSELLRWYFASLLCALGGAALIALLVWAVAARMWRNRSPLVVRVVFWGTLLLLAVAATPVGNRLGTSFIFTWPAALFAFHQFALWGILWGHRHRHHPRSQWVAMASVSLLIISCVIYFDICRSLDLAVMWVYLVGFLPSWPVTLVAAYLMAARVKPLRDMLWAVPAFSAYYWVSAAFGLWWLC